MPALPAVGRAWPTQTHMVGGWGASGVGEAEVGNVFNTCTDSEFHMASNSLTKLQEDQTNEYELKPSQLSVVTSLFDKTGPSMLWIIETAPWPNK